MLIGTDCALTVSSRAAVGMKEALEDLSGREDNVRPQNPADVGSKSSWGWGHHCSPAIGNVCLLEPLPHP